MYSEDKVVESIQISSQANELEGKGEIKQCIETYAKAIQLLETQLKFKLGENGLTHHKYDVFNAFLTEWKSKHKSLEVSIKKQSGDEAWEDLSMDDQYLLIKEEILSGHYYSDTCQFHGPHRKF